ncbi:ABC transporter ATP-binding protein [Thiofilum flexile]|uniref:ABC transporter ATP-binding protein n=1 Tax=Thiofilum flexile TaxID=125627 RepID=UPI00036C3FC7|nr:ABC transporter ATP-binding protein [Thiofilum flexile]
MSLTVDHVSKVVGRDTHIHPTTLTLAAGSLNVLLGATLAGKTSLMRLMAGLDKPTTGRILWQGQDVTAKPVQERNVAMVYQQFINYPSLSVYENIASPLKIRGLPKKTIQAKVHEAAELLKLTPMLKRRPLELSGGQQQRCALARALVKEADLVLLDEPLANLDYKLREELRVELPRIFTASGAVFVYTTTEPTEALLLGGNTITLHQGQVTQMGNTLEVYRYPQTLTTAQVFSDPPLNTLSVTKQNQLLKTLKGQVLACPLALQTLPDAPYTLGFRPHHFTLQPSSPHDLAFHTQVTVVELSGSESFIHLKHEEERWVALVGGIHDFPLGSAITLYVAPEQVYCFNEQGKWMSPPSLAQAA